MQTLLLWHMALIKPLTFPNIVIKKTPRSLEHADAQVIPKHAPPPPPEAAACIFFFGSCSRGDWASPGCVHPILQILTLNVSFSAKDILVEKLR